MKTVKQNAKGTEYRNEHLKKIISAHPYFFLELDLNGMQKLNME